MDEPRTQGTLSPGATRVWDADEQGWHPLWLTADEVPGVVADHFGVTVGPASLLTEGLLNQTWRLHGPDHDRVLRVSRPERTVEQVAWEHRFAAAVGAAVPAVVRAETCRVPVVRGHALTLYPFVAGRSGRLVAPWIRTRQVAAALAALHRAALDADLPPRPGTTAVDERPRWFGWPATRERLTAEPAPGTAQVVEEIDHELARLDDWLDRQQAAGRLDRRAAVHGDLNPRNLLFAGDDLVGIVDLDDCRIEPLAWEVAQTAYGTAGVPAEQVWRWYRDAGGPLPEADVERLAEFARIGALSELQWLRPDVEPVDRTTARLAGILDQLGGRVERDG
ncbi:Ser/Thr protein kinase RdoA (MazF antagonist) [Friedmanniella endophytica]|uniref:Ser/Thr protein kinase RdoA (MazF antagonist) n=1 Tax=Microlunatus kandeliicorticis TaxID=1759536 RepID=A0A7W3P6X7_9ACTN|nr:phosphotransferase [Microlunatus kandeliicorticis]MBA8795375.1 Ser/Thr protein kinase RdoA (MazF antagonist) [Microlunatus kandeliicorticis]